MAKKYLIILTVVLALALSIATIALADNYKPDDPVGVDSGAVADVYEPETKTETDTGAAGIAIAPESLWPGPDGFGYFGVDEVYSWVEITTTGTLVEGWTSKDDGYAGPFPIGFTFSFYGTDWTEFYAGSNGFLSFGAGATTFTNQCPLPSATAPNNIIPLLWDDLNLNTSGDAYYQTFADCPLGTGQCLVVEYYNAAHYGGAAGSAGTWEAILYESGDVVIQFLDSGVELGSGSTTGMENNDAASDYGLTYACNTADSITDGLSIRMFIPAAAPDLRDSHKEAPYLVTEGDSIHYRLVITNTGDAPALDAWMEDVIPDGSTYIPDSVICDAGTCSYDDVGNLIRWDGELLLPPEPVTVEFDVMPAACGLDIVNTAVFSDPAALAPGYSDTETFVVGDFYYTEDFEVDGGGYVSVGVDPWTWGPPPQGSLPWSTNAWSTEMPYVPDSDYQLVSDWIDLSGVNPDAPLNLGWWQYLWIESASWDHAYVEVTTDEVNWVVLWQHSGGTYNSNGWEPRSADISAFMDQQVKLRFRMDSDGSVQYDGWAIDDVVIYSGCTILAPDIVVDAPPLDATLPPDATTTLNFSISNIGDSALDWSLAELEGTQAIAKNVTTVLWDNGPLVTHPGGGFGGADASALQTALGMNTYGFGHQFSVGNRMADDFTVDDPEGWTIDTITFFDYQSFSPIDPSPTTGVYYQIWDGSPDDPGSTVVFGDLVTNRLLSSGFSNIYRVLDTSLTNADRGVFANVASAGVTLPPGTYWLDWMTDGNVNYSGPWAPPVTILGQTTTGNALQYTTSGGAWAPALDTGTSTQQDLPFILESGAVVDVLWLSEDPTSGTLDPGESVDVDVIYDSTGLLPDVYTAGLEITSNDPDQPQITLPVTLTVTEIGGPPDIEVDPLFLEAVLPVDSTATEPLTISNVGDELLEWQIFEAGWYDNFDSYAPGSQMHGQGGWKGWSNSPGAGALVSDLYSHSPTNSVEIVGASDLVHEYSGYTSGLWTYTAWQYIPADFTGQTYFIMLNQYDDGGVTNNWSTQVCYNSTTDRLYDDVQANCSSGASLSIIYDQWVEIRVEIDLDNDLQTFYYNGEMLYQDSWTDHVSGGGILNIGAVDLFANNASEVYYDDISLVGECGNPAEIPWLNVSPFSGVIDPGLFTPVDVEFDATGLDTGEYTAELCVASNDPDEPVVPVPVTMTVVAPAVDLVKTVGTEAEVCAETDAIEVEAGTEVYYCYTVENVGDTPLYYHTLADTALGLLFADLPYELLPGASYAYIHDAVAVTESVVNIGTWFADIELGGFSVQASDTASVTVLPPPPEPALLQVAHLAPFAMDPGTAVTITLNGVPALTNFAYGDSTGYIELMPGMYDVEVYPAGSPTPAITATVDLMEGLHYTAIAIGDGVNQDLSLLALVDDLTPPAAGKFKLRLGHLAPFAAGGATADVRLDDGTVILDDVDFGDVAPYLELDAGTYDLMITTPDGATKLIDFAPLTFNDGDILSAFATGEGVNQPLGGYGLPAGMQGFFLPLEVEEGYMIYLPLIFKP